MREDESAPQAVPTAGHLAPASDGPMVELSDVTKKFGTVTAVEKASFTVAKGDFLTILGPSGSGKSTLLRMIAGFDEPTSGEIFINGTGVSAIPAYRRAIGMVFQKLALFPHMTAAQNVAYPLKMRRFDPRQIPGLVERYLGLVRLQGYGERRINELSGGQQQRVAIARALVFQPDLLLLDEPLAALDRKLREEMQLEFRAIQQELGVTTINVTHDQREALVMSDQIVVMDDAKIQQTADPLTTYNKPSNAFVASFLGMTNVFSAHLQSADEATATVGIGDITLTGRNEGVTAGKGEVQCALRAERIKIEDTDRPAVTGTHRLPASIIEEIFEGDRLIYICRVPALRDAELRVVDSDPASHGVRKIDETVSLVWQDKDLLVFPA
ncbi:MAG: ABC transporter ATP-binding protein [Alphaproteobacteria bacterium]